MPVVCVTPLADLPVIVKGYEPTGVVALVAMASDVDPAPLSEDGDAVAVDPAGSPVTLKVTGLLKPPIVDSLTVYVAIVPATTDWLAGLAASEKSLFTTSVTPAEC